MGSFASETRESAVPIPFRLRGLVLSAGLACTVMLATTLPQAGAASAAPGSGPARWRVVQVIGPANGVTNPEFFDVTSRDDAWSWWISSCAPCPGPGPVSFLEHWNGTRWIKKTPPAAAAGIVGLGASSARNLWLFTVDMIRGHIVKRAVVWNGSWHTIRLPIWTISFSRAGFYAVQPEVFGPKSVWLFELALRAVDVYNGHRWTRHVLPGYPADVSVVSPTDIWAIGYAKTPAGRHFLMHWNGSRWRTLQIPRPARIPKNSIEYVGGLVATGPADLWLGRYIQTGAQGARTLYLLHWTRGRWHKVLFRFQTSLAFSSAQDGHGGLWLASNGPAPRYSWYFDHLSRTGRWTRQAGPTVPGSNFGQISAQFAPMAWIPGTTSVWATGNLYPKNNTNAQLGAIFKYGP